MQPTTRTLEATKAAEALGLKHFDKVRSNTPEEIKGNYLTIESGKAAAWKGYDIASGVMAGGGTLLGIAGLLSTAPILATIGAVATPVGVGLYLVGKWRTGLKARKDRHKYRK